MYEVRYKPGAQKDVERLDPSVAIRIIRKIDFYARQTNPLRFAKRLNRTALGEYRFRIGNYRIIFDADSEGIIKILIILKVGHRREIYN